MEILDRTFLGNTLLAWATALGIGLVTYIGLRVVMRVVVARARRVTTHTKFRWDDVILGALDSTKNLLLLVVALTVAGRSLALPAGLSAFLGHLTVLAFLWQFAIWVNAGIRGWLEVQRQERAADDAAAVMTMNVVGVTLRIGVWVMAFLLALENLGVDVTALVAGLGIGGIAVALAAQNVLGDLFASLSIVLDRPFVLGDALDIGGFVGTVEEIGLKTTRVRSVSGEQLVFSNADLLESRIRNFGRMYQRRASFEIGVTYGTPREQLEAIPKLIRAAVEEHGDKVRFDRSHMKSFGESAILFETVYHVLEADFSLYMDIQQAIYLRLHREFEERGVEFAYPTRTVILERAGAEA